MSKLIVRRSDFVRPLHADTRVSADSSFIDRFELSVGDWALYGEEDAICSALAEFRHAELITSHGEPIKLFNSVIIERLWQFKRMKFSKNPTKDSLTEPSTLISGSCARAPTNNRAVTVRPDEKGRICFLTQLNLTRFTQAQQLKKVTRLDRPSIASEHVLQIEPEPSWYEDEIPLMPATNVIIGPNKKYAYALKSPRTTQLRRYISLVQDILQNVVANAFRDGSARAEEFPFFTLRAIEFYWEFDQPSAIDYVISLRPRLEAQADDIIEDLYPVDIPSFRLKGQSPSFKMKLTKYISLKIYAKTNRRVRFEVEFRDSAINTHSGNRTSETIEGIVTLIPKLATEAAKRLNKVLQSIAPLSVPASSLTALQLMHVITREARHPYVAEAIIAALVSFGRIAPYNNDPLRETIHRLRDRNVLEPQVPKSSVYVVTEAYRESLERLRQFR